MPKIHDSIAAKKGTLTDVSAAGPGSMPYMIREMECHVAEGVLMQQRMNGVWGAHVHVANVPAILNNALAAWI